MQTRPGIYKPLGRMMKLPPILFFISFTLLISLSTTADGLEDGYENYESPDIIAEYEEATNITFQGDDLDFLLPKKDSPSSGIDMENIQGITWIMLITLFIMILVAALMSLYRMNPLFMFVLIGVILFVFGIVFSLTTPQQNFFSDIFMQDSWEDTHIENFTSIRQMKSMKLTSEDESNSIITKYIDIPGNFTEQSIQNSKNYRWEDENTAQEMQILEFYDKDSANVFVERYLSPVRKYYVDREIIYEMDQKDVDIGQERNSYYFNEERFVFLIFGEQDMAIDTAKRVVEDYPEPTPTRKIIDDRESPKIRFMQPRDKQYTNKKEIIFGIQDNKKIDIDSLTTRYNGKSSSELVPRRDCESMGKKDDVFLCRHTLKDLMPGKKTYRITVSDEDGNQVQDIIEFTFDTQRPEIEDLNIFHYSYVKGEDITFTAKDKVSGIDIRNSTITLSGKRSGLQNFCTDIMDGIDCTIPIKDQIKEGMNKIVIRIKDKAGNLAQAIRSFNLDAKEPSIEIIRPESTVYTDDSMIRFTIQDNNSGVDFNSIDVLGTSNIFNPIRDCRKLEEIIECNMNGGFLQGKNNLQINAEDNSGNKATIEKIFYYDTESPIIRLDSGNITNSKTLKFELYDMTSPIDKDFFEQQGLENFISIRDNCITNQKILRCNVIAGLEEGQNSYKLSIKDSAGNIQELQGYIIYDTTKPNINIFENYDDVISFEIEDDVEIDKESIEIEGVTGLDTEEDCTQENKKVYCNFEIGSIQNKLVTLNILDSAGNRASKTITI